MLRRINKDVERISEAQCVRIWLFLQLVLFNVIVDVGSAVVKLQCPGDRLQNTPLKCFGTCVVIVFFNAADRKKNYLGKV